MDRTQAMVRDIKEQVLTELQSGGSQSEGTYGRGYRAYCQLVDAVREEVLYDLKNRTHSAYTEQRLQLTPAEMEQIKREVVQELQRETGEQERRG